MFAPAFSCTGSKAFTPSESVAIAAELEPEAKAEAQRQREAGEAGKTGGRGKKKTLAGNSRKGSRKPTALDVVGKTLGRDRKTIAKAKAVVKVASSDFEKTVCASYCAEMAACIYCSSLGANHLRLEMTHGTARPEIVA